MKSRVVRFALVALCTVTVLVCTGAASLPSCASSAKPYVIKFAHVDPADVYTSKKHAQAVAFKTLVETRSGGA